MLKCLRMMNTGRNGTVYFITSDSATSLNKAYETLRRSGEVVVTTTDDSLIGFDPQQKIYSTNTGLLDRVRCPLLCAFGNVRFSLGIL
jgi:hypothetical protein